MTHKHDRRVAITGGMGNLAGKLIDHLLTRSGYSRLIGLDRLPPDPDYLARLQQGARRRAADRPLAALEMVQCDLTDWTDRGWRDVVDQVDTLVHFAARNPYPEADWGDARVTLDMILNVTQAAAESPICRRFILASSNHVMGRYKDAPLAAELGPGDLTTDLEPGVGTVWHTGQYPMDSTAYAVAKFAGERAGQAMARQTGGETTCIVIRIGWCQPGENRPETLSASGSPTLQGDNSQLDPETLARTEAWFKGMWLSNRDFAQLFALAIEAESDGWPDPCLIVNGVSNNSGMKWSLSEARRWLGYQPQDDVYHSG